MKEKMEDSKALPIPMLGKELGRFEGETFYIAEHEHGVLYHVYNSMDVIIRKGAVSGYEMLADYVRNKEEYEHLTGKEKEMFDLNLSAITYLLNAPTFVFSSAELTYEIATSIVKFLNDTWENANSQPMQKETVEEDMAFESAVMAMENIRKEVEDGAGESEDEGQGEEEAGEGR